MQKSQTENSSRSAAIMQAIDALVARTYARFPVVLERGQGCTVWDADGKAYTDFVAGIAVCNLGHAHPAVAAAVAAQAGKLVHVSNLYYTLPQVGIATALIENSFADRVFFCNSGAEANEAAIKLARKYFQEKEIPNRYRIVAMEKSFHGRTMATLSATGQDKIRKGFDPVLEGFDFVPFNDVEALRAKVDTRTCAVITEPIQGEGGVNCPDSGYLKEVRRICDESGALLIFDEIQTGMGRTGTLFAYQQYDVEPDIMTLAKALANGLPMGAMLAKEGVAEAFGPGAHATTFGATPLVTAAATEVFRVLTGEGILDNCREVGTFFSEKLTALKNRHSMIADVRGRGLIWGVELRTDGEPIVKACLAKGFLINCIQGNILRFVPPLVVTKEQVAALVECLDEIMQTIEGDK